jgi:hypothetical protein
MAQSRRPAFITIFAALNILIGLAGLGLAFANGALNVQKFEDLAQAEAANQESRNKALEIRAKQKAAGGKQKDAAGKQKGGLQAAAFGGDENPGAPAKARRPTREEIFPHPAAQSDVVGVLKEQREYLTNQVPTFQLYGVVAFVLFAVWSVLLIVGGIGLLRLRPASRRLMFLFVPFSLALTAGSVYYNYELLRPELIRWEHGRNALLSGWFHETPPAPNVPLMMNAMLGLSLCFGVAYPLLQAAVLSRRSARSAFAGRPVDTRPEPCPEALLAPQSPVVS